MELSQMDRPTGMSATALLIQLAGHVALLLWGIHMVHSGMLRAYGSALRRVLGRGLRHRVQALLAGVIVTALLQSSTATALMATSFAASGLVGLVPALAVMLGANIGSALVVLVLSFEVGFLVPCLLGGGIIAFKRSSRTRARDLGRVAIGLGLILLSIHLLVALVTADALGDAERRLFQALAGEPVLNLLAAAILAAAAHSSVAVVLGTVSLAAGGLLAPEAALAMVLGANLGSACNPILEGAGGDDPSRLRVPLGNLATRLVAGAIALPLLGPAASLLASLALPAGQAVAVFHVLLNLVGAAVFLPVLPALARALTRLLPARPSGADPGVPRYLDQAVVREPAMALANAAREVLRMADMIETMLRTVHRAVDDDDRDRARELGRMDDVVDRLTRAVERYVTAIDSEHLSPADRRRAFEVLTFAINLEHIGDIVDGSLRALAAKKIDRRLTLPAESDAEIEDMHGRLVDQLRLAVTVFVAGDLRSARRLIAAKDEFRTRERAATERHFDRLRLGERTSIETSGLVLDIIRDLKRIDAHIAATAYPLLEHSGALRATRLAGGTG